MSSSSSGQDGSFADHHAMLLSTLTGQCPVTIVFSTSLAPATQVWNLLMRYLKMSSKSKGKYLSNIVGLLCNWSAEELTMFLLLRSLMHEYTIMKWLAGLPPLFASPSPLTSPDSFTRVCFFTFPTVDDFLLFHPWMIFCFFTRGCFLLSCCDHRLCFHHLCFCASTTRLG